MSKGFVNYWQTVKKCSPGASNNNIELDNMALQVGERLGQAPALPGIPVDTAHVALGLDLLLNDDDDDSCDNDDNENILQW